MVSPFTYRCLFATNCY